MGILFNDNNIKEEDISITKKELANSYEQEVTNCEIEMLRSAQKYVNNEADTIFIHCVYNNTSMSIDYFYRFKLKILHPADINQADNVSLDHFDVSKERQELVLKDLTAAMVRMVAAAKKFEKKMPAEIRLTYDMKSNQLIPQYSYDIIDANYFSRSHQDWFYFITNKINKL